MIFSKKAVDWKSLLCFNGEYKLAANLILSEITSKDDEGKTVYEGISLRKTEEGKTNVTDIYYTNKYPVSMIENNQVLEALLAYNHLNRQKQKGAEQEQLMLRKDLRRFLKAENSEGEKVSSIVDKEILKAEALTAIEIAKKVKRVSSVIKKSINKDFEF